MLSRHGRLRFVLRDARLGDVVVVDSDAPREHVEQAAPAAGRGEVVVRQQEAPTAAGWS